MTSTQQFINQLSKFISGYKSEAIAPANNEVATQIYEKSQGPCPVRTGYLKSTGYQESDENHFEVGYRAEYAAAVNFGTFKMAPRPFFTDAVTEVTLTAQSIYATNLKRYWDSLQ